MKIYTQHKTRQDLAESAAERWFKQYAEDFDEWPDKKEKYEKLKALNPITPERVNEIIDNDSWTTYKCEKCRKHSDLMIIIESDYLYRICASCIEKINRLIKRKQK